MIKYLLIFGISLVLTGCQIPEKDDTADKDAILRLILQTEEMNRTGDAEGWVALFEEGAVYMPPNMPAVDTREGIVELAVSGFSAYRSEVEIEPLEIEIADDWAYVRSTVKGSAIPIAEGDTIDVDMKQLVIYRRQADGTWKIARLIGNKNSY